MENLQSIKIETIVYTNKSVYPLALNLDDYDTIEDMLRDVLNHINERCDTKYFLDTMN